jgi:hypothetical protein
MSFTIHHVRTIFAFLAPWEHGRPPNETVPKGIRLMQGNTRHPVITGSRTELMCSSLALRSQRGRAYGAFLCSGAHPIS